MEQNEESVFDAALALADSKERAAYLDRACAGDPALRKNIESLLSAYAAGAYLEAAAGQSRPVDTTAPYHTPDAGPGTTVGPYRLMEQIGEGGMGLVFVAEQTHPVRRKVALKVIKPGMDTRQVVARFEAERQALALMDHPHIAKVLDAGATTAGRPYFVMELVKGTAITAHCDAHKLGIRDRLALFLQVCEAVQHAHQKGVIHRDLKPTNVLVTVHDVAPVAKVIDFGIAKAVGQLLTDKTVYTGFAQVIGTPLYMSPEQAGQSGLDVDTRTDVYALGVLLYELLTGTTPIDPAAMKSVGYHEVLRIIREDAPPRPSARLSTLKGEALSTVADRRAADGRRLAQSVRGELDWVVMKCLEKDRNRRYESASALAADVRRYLADEPVHAHPPSAGYRLRKFVRRNKGPVLAGVLVLATLVGGAGGTTWGWLQASAAESRARAEAEDKDRARAATAAERDRAIRAEEAAKRDRDAALAAEADTKAFTRYLVNHVLAAGRPKGVGGGLGVDVTLAQALEASEGKLATVFAGQPRAEAIARHATGVTWHTLGRYAKAVEHLERAAGLYAQEYGPDHPDTLLCQAGLAQAYSRGEHWKKAAPLLERVLERRTALLGPDHPDTLDSMHLLGWEYLHIRQVNKAQPLLERVLERRTALLGPHHAATASSIDALAKLYEDQFQYSRAEPLYVGALAIRTRAHGEEHSATLASMNNLAVLYGRRGQYAKAEPLLVRAVDISRRIYGDGHPNTITANANLGFLYLKRQQYAKAEPLLVEAHAVRRRVHGDEHHETLISMHELATLYEKKRDYPRAEELFIRMLEINQRLYGDEHPSTVASMNNLGIHYGSRGQHAKAEPLLVRALDASRRVHGNEHHETLVCMGNLGKHYKDRQQHAKAEPLLARALEISRLVNGNESPHTLTAMHNLAGLYFDQSEYAKAEPLLVEALEGRRRVLGEEQTDTLGTMNNLATAYGRQQKYAEAGVLYARQLDVSRRVLGDEHPETLTAEVNLAAVYQARGRFAEAEPMVIHTLEVRRRVLPKGHPHTLIALQQLASLYQDQGRYDLADPRLREAVEFAREHAGENTPQHTSALASYGLNLLHIEKYAEAEPVLRLCLKIREAQDPENWLTFNTLSLLGGALLGQKKYAEAEPLLLKGYAGMKEREAKIPPVGRTRLSEAASRLADLSEGTGQPEKAKEWRAKAGPVVAPPPRPVAPKRP